MSTIIKMAIWIGVMYAPKNSIPLPWGKIERIFTLAPNNNCIRLSQKIMMPMLAISSITLDVLRFLSGRYMTRCMRKPNNAATKMVRGNVMYIGIPSPENVQYKKYAATVAVDPCAKCTNLLVV